MNAAFMFGNERGTYSQCSARASDEIGRSTTQSLEKNSRRKGDGPAILATNGEVSRTFDDIEQQARKLAGKIDIFKPAMLSRYKLATTRLAFDSARVSPEGTDRSPTRTNDQRARTRCGFGDLSREGRDHFRRRGG